MGTSARQVSYPDDHATCLGLEDSSFWFNHRNQCVISVVRRFPPAGEILDVGGGNGYVTRGLIDAGFSAALLEPGPAGARNARNVRGIPTVICAALEDCAFEPGTLAAVGLFDVLEHIEDDASFLRLIHEQLAPGGMLYVSVPAHQWLWSMSDVDAQHYRRYSRADLVSRLSDGFEVLYCTCFFRVLVIPFWVKRTLPYLLGRRQAHSETDYRSQHLAARRSLAHAMLDSILRRERLSIAAGRSVHTGTSCLAVARKRGE
jgi:SAM-dependent methyltransferase